MPTINYWDGTTWNPIVSAVPVWMFGDGSDGALTLSSALASLNPMTRDWYFTNLTIQAGAQITTNGYRIYVSGTLDLSAAPVGAFLANGVAGGNALGQTAGSSGGGGLNGYSTIPRSAGSNGGGGGNANTAGSNASATNCATFGTLPTVLANGGTGGAGAAAAGTGGTHSLVCLGPTREIFAQLPRVAYNTTLLAYGVEPSEIGCGGGGGGGATTTAAGGGGGAGGTGGGLIAIYANTIARGSNSTANIFQANGGVGGNGAAGGAGPGTNAGGGGGGGGGAGGSVFLYYTSITGSTITNAIQVNGGNGGAGGAVGTGGTGGSAGTGGNGACSGYVLLCNVATITYTITDRSIGTAGSGTTGGTGKTQQANL